MGTGEYARTGPAVKNFVTKRTTKKHKQEHKGRTRLLCAFVLFCYQLNTNSRTKLMPKPVNKLVVPLLIPSL